MLIYNPYTQYCELVLFFSGNENPNLVFKITCQIAPRCRDTTTNDIFSQCMSFVLVRHAPLPASIIFKVGHVSQKPNNSQFAFEIFRHGITDLRNVGRNSRLNSPQKKLPPAALAKVHVKEK